MVPIWPCSARWQKLSECSWLRPCWQSHDKHTCCTHKDSHNCIAKVVPESFGCGPGPPLWYGENLRKVLIMELPFGPAWSQQQTAESSHSLTDYLSSYWRQKLQQPAAAGLAAAAVTVSLLPQVWLSLTRLCLLTTTHPTHPDHGRLMLHSTGASALCVGDSH